MSPRKKAATKRAPAGENGVDDALSPAPPGVLILDDEQSILDILGDHLSNEGYGCTATDDPKHALNSLKAGTFSLLISDLRMPSMSGIEVVKHAREIAPDLAIIIITAAEGVETAVQAMRAGADDYVTKPFNLGEISLAVARVLDKRRLVLENRRYQSELERRVNETTEDLRHTRDYLENLINSTIDAILTIDANGRIHFANRGARTLVGRTKENLDGQNLADFLVGGKEEVRYLRRVLEPNKPLQNYQTEIKGKSGDLVPISVSVSLIPGAGPDEGRTLLICKDVTDQKNLERDLKEMSIRDGLTSLYNVRHFYDRLEAEVERSKRQKRPLSLLLIDVDGFKTYNDAHGHLAGDGVLKAVAEVLEVCTREHVDLPFRYGGDEFTVVLPEADEKTAHVIADRVRETFERKRFDLLTLSIGLMTYSFNLPVRQFIQYADSVMYEAKRAGGNQVRVYEPAT